MEIKLIVTGGKTRKGHVVLAIPATIGRSREADLTIAHATVSRQHCRLFEVDGLLRVRDMGSLNGTLVSGETITEAPLRPNDEFTVGPVTFRVDYDYGGEATAEGPGVRRRGKRARPPKHDVIELVAENVTVVPAEASRHPALSSDSGQGPVVPGIRETIAAGQDDDIALDVEIVAPQPQGPSPSGLEALAGEPPAVDLAPPDGQLPDFGDWERKTRPKRD